MKSIDSELGRVKKPTKKQLVSNWLTFYRIKDDLAEWYDSYEKKWIVMED